MGQIDFYISEMSVSDSHGGGITLQRVLGDDLGRIGRFVHVSRLAKDIPPVQNIEERSEFVLCPFETDSSRELIGCRASSWLSRMRCIRSWHCRRAAAQVSALFPGGETLTALVCPQSLMSIRTIEILKRKRQVRYITWLMDDHIVRYCNGEWVYPPVVKNELARHLGCASSVFVISPALGDFYHQEFGVDAEVLFGPADPQENLLCEAPLAGRPLMIGYFGRLWEWQSDAMVEFATVLRAGAETLHVYTPESTLPQGLRLPAVEVRAAVKKELVPEVMRNYDAVLIPIGFSADQRNLAEFNIATKMAECLASGTLTILFGPSYAAMIRFLGASGAACVLTDRGLRTWPEVARSLKDPKYRRKVLNSAQHFVSTQLSTSIMRARWSAGVNKLLNRVA